MSTSKNIDIQRILRVSLIAFFCLVFFGMAWEQAANNSLCHDEAKHIVTGKWLLEKGKGCLGGDNSPLTALFALTILGSDYPFHSEIGMTLTGHAAGNLFLMESSEPLRIIFAARLSNIVLGLFTILLSAALAKRFFGGMSALLTVAILVVDPNILANFSLASTDAQLAFSVLLFLFCLDTYGRCPSLSRACLLGISLGVALISKYTAIILIPALGLLILYHQALRKLKPQMFASSLVVMGLMALVVVWVGYGLNLSAAFPYFHIPGYWEGMLEAKGYSDQGMRTFFMGEVGRSWAWYFPVVLLLKIPAPVWILWCMGLLAMLLQLRRQKDWRLLGPVLLAGMFVGVCLLSSLNIGLRHALPMIPLLAVTAGATVGLVNRYGRIVIIALIAWLWAESFWVYPHSLSYINYSAGGPERGRHILGDSNLDWGQDLFYLRDILADLGIQEVILAYVGNTEPAKFGVNYQHVPYMFLHFGAKQSLVAPQNEILAVSLSNLQGIYYQNDDLGWLREREPIARAGYSIYLYDIRGDKEAHAHLADLYDVFGESALGDAERDKAAAYDTQP